MAFLVRVPASRAGIPGSRPARCDGADPGGGYTCHDWLIIYNACMLLVKLFFSHYLHVCSVTACMKAIGKRSRNPVLFWQFRNPTQNMFGEKEDVWSPYLKPKVLIRFVKNAWCIHTAECIAFQSILYYKVYYLIAYTNAQHVPSLSSVCAISLQQC